MTYNPITFDFIPVESNVSPFFNVKEKLFEKMVSDELTPMTKSQFEKELDGCFTRLLIQDFFVQKIEKPYNELMNEQVLDGEEGNIRFLNALGYNTHPLDDEKIWSVSIHGLKTPKHSPVEILQMVAEEQLSAEFVGERGYYTRHILLMENYLEEELSNGNLVNMAEDALTTN